MLLLPLFTSPPLLSSLSSPLCARLHLFPVLPLRTLAADLT